MTTINNLTIEQMREIVEGAPGRAEVCIPCLEDVMYFAKRDDGKWFKWSNGYNQWLEYFGKVDPMDLALDLNDLRTAIAEHDREFKVGDLVCFIDSRIMFPDGETKTNELFRVIRSNGLEVDLTEIGKLKIYKTWVGDLRNATPSEIKAGHRLEAERHG